MSQRFPLKHDAHKKSEGNRNYPKKRCPTVSHIDLKNEEGCTY